MNSLVNRSKTLALPELSYGYINNGQTTKWIFWEYNSYSECKKFCLEINSVSNRLNLVDSASKSIIPLKNTPGFYQALGVDWLTKAMPHPYLYMNRIFLEQVALRKITNPTDLATFILGVDLSEKIPSKQFFRSVLSNDYFETWDKIKIAILLLMVTDNVNKTLENIESQTIRFNRNYSFYRIVNLSLKKGLILNLFLNTEKLNQHITLLDKEDKFLFKDFCYVSVDGEFDSCIDLVSEYKSYESKAKSIAEFGKEKHKSIYIGELNLPKGMELIDNPDDLIKEGRRMSHCVGSYVPKLLSKKSFFMHVKLEKSATVEIVKNTKKRCFEVFQIKGASNSAVPSSVTINVKKAVSSYDVQHFFFKNSYKSRKRKSVCYDGPTLFDGFEF
jgi:uncharacterized membrane protein